MNKIKLIPKNQNASRPVKTRLQIRDEQLQLWDSEYYCKAIQYS